MTPRISPTGFIKAFGLLVLAVNIGIAVSFFTYGLPGPLRLRTTTIRELAYGRERTKGDGRAVYVVLYEYYHADTLVITEEAMAYVGPLEHNVVRYGRYAEVDVVQDVPQFAEIDWSDDVLTTVTFGPDAKKTAFLLQGEEGQEDEVIYGVRSEEGIVFAPASSLGR